MTGCIIKEVLPRLHSVFSGIGFSRHLHKGKITQTDLFSAGIPLPPIQTHSLRFVREHLRISFARAADLLANKSSSSYCSLSYPSAKDERSLTVFIFFIVERSAIAIPPSESLADPPRKLFFLLSLPKELPQCNLIPLSSVIL